MTPMPPAPVADDGFVHLGVLPRDADDLVACLAPELSVAHGHGHHVVTVLDRPTGRRMREALEALTGAEGAEGAAGVEALVPGQVHAAPPEELLATVRAALASVGRVLVVVQWPEGVDADRITERERTIAHLLADEPVTLVCAAPSTPGAELTATLCAEHPVLLGRTGRRRHAPDHTDPHTEHAPAALRTAVRGPSDLRGVRQSVARMAGGVGLDTDETAAAVLAVHEAALLATGIEEAERAGHGAGFELPAGTACLVRVWAEGAALVTEVTGPAAGPEPCLRVVRLFAADAEVRDGVQDGVPVRAVRVRSASA